MPRLSLDEMNAFLKLTRPASIEELDAYETAGCNLDRFLMRVHLENGGPVAIDRTLIPEGLNSDEWFNA